MTDLSKAKNILVMVIFSLTASGSANANDCSKQVNAFISGLETAATTPFVPKDNAADALSKIDCINSMRKVKDDCELSKLIPFLLENADSCKKYEKPIVRHI